MKVLYELNKNPNLSICLGFFDGIHQGHQIVIKNTVNFAKNNGLKSGLITFSTHPLNTLLGYDIKYISTLPQRLEYIEKLGIDYVYVINFDNELAKMNAYKYLKDILIEYFEPKAITTGFNHTFGAKKEGNSNFLKAYQKNFNYKYFEIPPITYNNITISSSKIKELLAENQFEKATKLLGHNIELQSTVIEGNQIGKSLGFPTANINYPEDMVALPFGVYSTKINLGGEIYKGIANWGMRPTVNNTTEPIFEIHILNFNNNIYGKLLKIELVDYIRDEISFKSTKELKKQIEKDIQTIKTFKI